MEELYSIKSWNWRRIIEKLRLIIGISQRAISLRPICIKNRLPITTSWRLKKKNLTPGFLFFPSSPGPLSSPPADRPRNWSSPTALHELSRTRSHSTGSNRGPDFFARKKPSCWAILSWPANWKAARENGHATGRYRSRPSRAGSTSSYSTSG